MVAVKEWFLSACWSEEESVGADNIGWLEKRVESVGADNREDGWRRENRRRIFPRFCAVPFCHLSIQSIC